MSLDFATNLDYVWALLPEIVLCVWGMVVLLTGVSEPHRDTGEAGPKAHPDNLGWLAFAGVLVAALANGWLYGVEESGSAGMVAVDRFRLFANWTILASAALGISVSMTYVHRQRLQAGEFYGLMLLATAGMMFMVGARDLIIIFLGLEVMSISVYALAAFNRRDRRSAEAGLKYFLLGAFSTGFLLYGIALTYGATGSTQLEIVAESVASGTAHDGLLAFGVGLLAVGFGFKVAAVPFHMWTPDVYEGAPSPVTAFMSAAVKAAAFVAFVRVFTTGFVGVHEMWYPILWWLAAITMVVANLVALAQTSIKRMLAYSSIAHAGYLLVAVTAASEVATAGLLFYLLVYAVMNVGAFAVVITVSRQGEENLQIEDYAGLGQQQPVLAAFLTIFLLSLAGFPGTGGFIGKIYLLRGAVDAGLWTLSVILVLTTLVSYYYYLRVAWYAWMRAPTTADRHADMELPAPMRLALVVGVAVVLYLGVFPASTLDLAQSSVTGLGVVGGALSGAMP